MKLILKLIAVLFVVGLVACKDTKKEEEASEVVDEQIQAIEAEIDSASMELDENAKDLEQSIKDLDDI